MKHVRHWAIEHARSNHLRYVRMDTWGDNQQLRNYYITCGFSYIGQKEIPMVNQLPAHYGGPELSLFELDVVLFSAPSWE